MSQGPLQVKSYTFSLKIISLSKFLFERREYVLGKQVLRSGTSIGAQIQEAKYAISRKDFRSKMCGALKEANETQYWLQLLKDSNSISTDQHSDAAALCNELIAMLVSTVKTTK